MTGTSQNWQKFLPYIATALVMVLIWAWYLTDLGVGNIYHYDEFYTYDRSSGFARNGDWLAVYSNNEPSLKKPPMQYWMSALLMQFGVSDILALRLPSMIFALAALMATALLARVMIPRSPWAMLPSVLLVASSLQFWQHATSAMLDTGAVFFSTLSIAALLAAIEKPKYWPYFGATIVLAALQKSPTPLAFLALALLTLKITNRWQAEPFSDVWRNRTFRRTLKFAIPLAFAWPILQELRFLFDGSLDGNIKGEMLDRFRPSLSDRGFGKLYDLVIAGDPWPRLLGFVAICALPFVQQRPRLLAATGIAVFFVIMMWAAAGKVYARYTLLILPMLMVAATGLLFSVKRLRWAGMGAALGLCFLSGGVFYDRAATDLGKGRVRLGVPEAEILAPLGAKLQSDETLLVCAYDRKMRVPPGAASVFASNGRPFIYLRRLQLQKYLDRFGYSSGPLRGLCTEAELSELAPGLVGLATEPTAVDGLVYWSATGVRDPSD
ncbi:Dolichyl-phosphate-mannose-protein mannosyltransferase [Ruegeria halocynthiae]|uniref:Dolichyl-phosphate-mannose-protein mannosyltransferase n=1 Tax=Ruegeria halocynthiae TaxID=985054 RepID=A0A1H3A1T9_9RHOB|nr:glycosyltransferase family 39 protein [Ruegeria halocynthiae]SDX23740.1 Dolichyl-phosphate-mannose-protein mannosyltransferase [Ruegeria halocynthiae]